MTHHLRKHRRQEGRGWTDGGVEKSVGEEGRAEILVWVKIGTEETLRHQLWSDGGEIWGAAHVGGPHIGRLPTMFKIGPWVGRELQVRTVGGVGTYDNDGQMTRLLFIGGGLNVDSVLSRL